MLDQETLIKIMKLKEQGVVFREKERGLGLGEGACFGVADSAGLRPANPELALKKAEAGSRKEIK